MTDTDQPYCEWDVATDYMHSIAPMVPYECHKPAKAIAIDGVDPVLVCGIHRNVARRQGMEIRETISR